MHSVTRQLHWWRGLVCGAVVLGVLTWALPVGTAQEETTGGERERLTPFLPALGELRRLLRHLTVTTDDEGRPEVRLTGANLRLVNGLGSTDCIDDQGQTIPDCPNGLGNVIVGYNERRAFGENLRMGSHNVVVGQEHNFSHVGGLVVGFGNTISGAFAVVSGGSGNEASAERSSVSGGFGNIASGGASAVSGGRNRTAAGEFDWVAGSLIEDE